MNRVIATIVVPSVFFLLTAGFTLVGSDALAQDTARVANPSDGVCSSGGSCFAKKISLGGKDLPLRGVSLFEYYGFDVYSGAFYADPETNSIDKALEDRPKYLVLEYHRKLERQNFIDNTEFILEKNKEISLPKVRTEMDSLYKLYTDVKQGDRYALGYESGKGMTLYLNGVAQGTILGVDFQKACYSIWISRYSVGKDFTAELLGLKK